MMRRIANLLMAAIAALLLALSGLKIAPSIEATVAPVRTNQRIAPIERTATTACWAWDSYKALERVSTGISVSLDTTLYKNADRSPWERHSHMPWQASMAKPAHEWSHQEWCVDLPPYVKEGDVVTIHQTALYPGFLGLWTVSLPIPDVSFPEVPR